MVLAMDECWGLEVVTMLMMLSLFDGLDRSWTELGEGRDAGVVLSVHIEVMCFPFSQARLSVSTICPNSMRQ